MPTDRVARVLAGAYTADLADLSTGEVRARRAECQEIELGLSYARRVVQGRFDIIHAEIERRGTGHGRSGAAELVDRLKGGEMLTDHGGRPPGYGRLSTLLAPAEDAAEVREALSDLPDADSLANLPDLADEAIGDLADRLTQRERQLSARRREVLDRIDVLQAEIVRRYKEGMVDPEELLG